MVSQSKHIISALILFLLFTTELTGNCAESLSNSLNVNYSDTASIKVKKAEKLIKGNIDNPQFVILDVRKPDDYLKEHIANAINIDFKAEDFSGKLDQLDKSKIYLVYCYGGFRSRNTMQMMEKKGFTKIYNMKGGVMKWRAKRLPLVSG